MVTDARIDFKEWNRIQVRIYADVAANPEMTNVRGAVLYVISRERLAKMGYNSHNRT